jgi:hypothetical protein
MPVGVVKNSRDEHLWNKAKSVAEKQGRAKDWAYIMGIYQKMSGDHAEKSLTKSTTAHLSPKFILTKWPGQVPSRENIDMLRYTKEMPKEPTTAQLLDHGGTYLTPRAVIDGLGLSKAQEQEWSQFLHKALRSQNELVMRHEVVGKMLADRMDPDLRRALFQRALSCYRDLRKSQVEVVTVDELKKSENAYIVENNKQGDPEERMQRIIELVCTRVANGSPEGLSLDNFADITKNYGTTLTAKALNNACAKNGVLIFQNGMLRQAERNEVSDDSE